MSRPSIRRSLFISLLIGVLLVWGVMIALEILLAHYEIQASLSVLLIGLPVLAALLWYCVGLNLNSLKKLSEEITHRASHNLSPINIKNIPTEVRPIVEDLNHLFEHVKQALANNKRFASDAAHELKTPLAATKLQAQIAVKAKTPEELKTALNNLIKSVDRSAHITEQLLTLSRVGPEATSSQVHPVDVQSITAEIMAMLAPTALKKNIDFALNAEAKNTRIIANEVAIGILVRNIIENAIQYTPDDGLVHVSIFNQQATLILRVIDSGPGIPEELRDRVFERFFRILGTDVNGSGLGLAIVKQIADLYQATIQLSTPENGIGLQIDVCFRH